MTHTDDIDERRARALWRCVPINASFDDGPDNLRQEMIVYARAIRESDEAAGYILIKHEGVISSEGMKPKGEG